MTRIMPAISAGDGICRSTTMPTAEVVAGRSASITGYRLEVAAAALGYPIAASVRIRPMPGQLGKIAELAQAMPQVVECDRITGEDCFILKIYLERLDDLDRVLDRFLAYGQTTTLLVQSSPVPPRELPLPGDDGA